jgi:exosortase
LDSFANIAILAVAALLLLLERFRAFRRSEVPVYHRWLTNTGLVLVGALTTAALFPASLADIANAVQVGIVGQLHLPMFLEATLVFLFLDFWRYWEHRVFHEVPPLWRIHLVHHSDTAIDVTTSQRHHPFERIIVTLLAIALIFSLGISAGAIGIYLLIAMLSSLWSHANIALPDAFDKALRKVLVTPAVHAMHHSSHQPETDSDYGAVLTIWDRLFGTYTTPGTGPARIGLAYFRSAEDNTLVSSLLQPFRYRRHIHNSQAIEDLPVVDAATTTPLSSAWRRVISISSIGFGMALLIMWPTVLDLGQLWVDGHAGAYQYAWLVMPMFFYLVGWHHRESILAMTPEPGYAGLPLAIVALLLWLAAFINDFNLGQHLAFVLVLQAIALSALGRDLFRQLLPIMLLLFFMIPCGDFVQPLLRDLTLKWMEWFALIGDLPHSINGFYINIGDYRYHILGACSGLAFFTLAGFLGYSYSLLLSLSLTRAFTLAALGATLGILANAARVCLIVAVDRFNGIPMNQAGHDKIQWMVMALCVGILLLLVSKLKQEEWSATAKAECSLA